MKKIIIFFAFFTLSSTQVLAQTPVPSKNSIGTSENIAQLNNKIDELKNKVASKVAQLKLVEKRGFVGTVISVSDTQLTISDLNDNTRFIDVDEFTKFSSEDDDSFGISDIKKGSKVSALGLYNKESERLLARFINETTLPLFLHGVITKKDDDNFTLSLALEDGTQYLVDVERITKTLSFSKEDFETSGFTDLEINQNAVVIGFPDPKEKNRLTASRVIVFPGTPKNPKVPVVEEIVPSTGSGKKLTPLSPVGQ